MAINQHHTIEEINGIRCSVIERNITRERIEFIKPILEANNLKTEVSEISEGLYIIGVTYLTFNIVHALYARQLYLGKEIITPSFWKSQVKNEGFYWQNRK